MLYIKTIFSYIRCLIFSVFGRKTNRIGYAKQENLSLQATAYLYRIYDWQRRESRKPWIRTQEKAPTNIKQTATKIRNQVLKEIKYKPDKENFDKKEYWATTRETLSRGVGDCEDQAFVIYRRLYEAGFNHSQLGVCLIEGHVFAIFYYKEDDFYILDNGYMTYAVVEASRFYWSKGKPICGFNLYKIWSY